MSRLTNSGSENRIVIGKLGGPHGVRGWIKVMSHMDPRESVFQFSSWFLNVTGQWQTFELEDAKPQGKGFLVKLKGIDDCDVARQYMHCDIAVDESQIPELDEGEFYWRELIGLTVINQQQVTLGTVKSLIETGSNDVLRVVSQTEDKKERLIPYIDSAVIEIKLDEQCIVVDWPEDWD